MKRSLAAITALAIAAAGCATTDAQGTDSASETTSSTRPAAATTVYNTPDTQAKAQCRLLIDRELPSYGDDWGDHPVRESSDTLWSWDSTVTDGSGQPWRFGCFYYPESNKVALLYLDKDQ